LKELKDKIISIVSKITKIDPTVLAQDASGNLWDSFTHLEIIFALEECFKVSLIPEEIASMRSIEAILAVLLKKTGK
jgi:acyl carrier protein